MGQINRLIPDVTCSHVNRQYAVLRQNQTNTTFMHNSENANNSAITI